MVDKQPQSKQIYIFQNEMYPILKIGMSDNPLKRMKQVQGGAGFPLKLMYESEPVINPTTVERLIHKELKEYRRGGEWFELDVKIAKQIIEKVLTICIKGEYRDLSLLYQIEDECTTLLDYNIHKSHIFDVLTEIEPFVYENKAFYYYITFKQGILERTIKFCSKGLALKFKKDNLERLISR